MLTTTAVGGTSIKPETEPWVNWANVSTETKVWIGPIGKEAQGAPSGVP